MSGADAQREQALHARLELIEGRPLDYLVKRAGADAESAPPLLCFLHGYGEAAPLDVFDAVSRHGPLKRGNPAAQVERFVVVAPQLPVAGDSWAGYATDVRRIIREEIERRHCDPRRIYLTGFSFGGNGVFDLAIAHPDMWAALWPVDPTRVPGSAIGRPIWLSSGEISRTKTSAFIRALALEHAEGNVAGDRVWSDEGEDHTGTATLAYRDRRIYQWLLSKRRKER